MINWLASKLSDDEGTLGVIAGVSTIFLGLATAVFLIALAAFLSQYFQPSAVVAIMALTVMAGAVTLIAAAQVRHDAIQAAKRLGHGR